MSFETSRFKGEIRDQFICSICCNVLHKPVQRVACEHIFCEECIKNWLTRQENCPIDRQPLTVNELRPAPRVLQSILEDLEISCDFSSNGCVEYIRLVSLDAHVKGCKYNPNLIIGCNKGCGATFEASKKDAHSCTLYMKETIVKLNHKIKEQASWISNIQEALTEKDDEVTILKAKIAELELNARLAVLPAGLLKMVESLKTNGVMISKNVEEVMVKVDRAKFCPEASDSYQDRPKNIAPGINTSAPHMIARALEVLKNHLKPGSTVLDVGSGCGYVTTLMALMVANSGDGKVVGVEINESLAGKSITNIRAAGFGHYLDTGKIKIICKDGKSGYLLSAPYDVIYVGAAYHSVPNDLQEQLKTGGRMLIPVGTQEKQFLEQIDKAANGSVKKVNILGVLFGYLT